MYVICKMLQISKQEEETQHHKLFQNRCCISNKFLDVVIDSDSFENIIFRQLVKKLQLPVEKHLEPYKMDQIKEVETIKVVDRCKVRLSISQQSNLVMCDTVNMNVCQLLLGCP